MNPHQNQKEVGFKRKDTSLIKIASLNRIIFEIIYAEKHLPDVTSDKIVLSSATIPFKLETIH